MHPGPLYTLVALIVLVVAGVAFGIVIYLAGSFALMRPYAEARPLRASLVALLREAWWVIITQPLLPLFYLLGHRLGRPWLATHPSGPPIVLVHGYMHNRVGFLGLARALARRDRGPLYAINYPWYATIESNAERLARFVDDVRRATGAPQVDLVCHSMGGLVAMEMLRVRAERGSLPVRRLVTIATPHAGVVFRGPMLGFGAASLRRGSKLLATHAELKLAIPCLSIFSTHDNVVHPKHTSVLAARGGRDLEIPEVGHLSILFSERVADAVAQFLAEPDAARAAGEAGAEADETFAESVARA